MGRRSIKDLRRQEIVKAFYDTAKAEGLHNTSIAKIAEVMEVNPSLILHYFKNKDELLLELIDYILDRYLKIYTISDKGSSLDQLVEILNNMFSRKWNNLISDDVYYSCYCLIFRDATIRNKYKKLHDSLRSSLADHLTKCVKDGFLHIESPTKTANFIYTVLDGAYYYLCMEKDRKVQDEIMTQCKDNVIQILKLDPEKVQELS